MGYIGPMFEVLVFVYENYWRGDACPEPEQLGRKLSAHGFDAEEIIPNSGPFRCSSGRGPRHSRQARSKSPAQGEAPGVACGTCCAAERCASGKSSGTSRAACAGAGTHCAVRHASSYRAVY